MKNKKYITAGAAAAVAVIAVVGMAFSSFAAGGGVKNYTADKLQMFRENNPERGCFQNLNEENKKALIEKREERRAAREEKREAVDAAIEAENYDAWMEAVGENHPWASDIDEEDFSKIIEIHGLKTEIRDNHKKIGEIMDELGVERPGKRRMSGFMHGDRGMRF